MLVMRLVLPATLCLCSAAPAETVQYIVFNRAPGQGMYQGEPESLGRKAFDEVLAQFPNAPGKRVQTAVSHCFPAFRTPPETTVKALRVFLDAVEQTSTPILIVHSPVSSFHDFNPVTGRSGAAAASQSGVPAARNNSQIRFLPWGSAMEFGALLQRPSRRPPSWA